MDKSRQSGRREKKTEGIHDNWKEINYAPNGSVSVRDKDNTVTKYKSKDDMKKGKFKEIRYN